MGGVHVELEGAVLRENCLAGLEVEDEELEEPPERLATLASATARTARTTLRGIVTKDNGVVEATKFKARDLRTDLYSARRARPLRVALLRASS